MSATSEDDSLYDNHTPHEKMSQGSAGSEFTGHEIPIMIEAEAPPGMMPNPPAPNPVAEGPMPSSSPHTGEVNGPVPPLVGQVRKSPQFATRTLSSSDNKGAPGHPRATRCSSEPPQQTVEQQYHGSPSINNEVKPQATTRSATAPIHGQNHTLPRQFGSTHRSHGNFPRTPAPIAEENFVNNGQIPGQPQHMQQQTHIPDDIHRPRGHSQQPSTNHHDQQPPFFQNPGGYQDHHDEPAPPQRSGQRPSVIRNIPIFIEGQDQPIVNEDHHGSIPETQPPETHHVPQHQPFQQPDERQFWNDRDQFFNQHPSRQMFDEPDHVSSSPRQRFYSHQHPQNYYRQEEPQHREHPFYKQRHQQQQPHPQQFHPQEQNLQDFGHQPQNSPRNYQQRQTQGHQQQPQQQRPPQYHYSQPTQQPRQEQHPQTAHHPDHSRSHQVPPGSHEIPVHFNKTQSTAPTAPQPPPRQPSPQPRPPPQPVKLTPIERIDKVRESYQEFADQVNTFNGTKDCKNYIYLEEMLTRAIISLDDIDPDGNVEIRQHRKALIRDIESTLGVLEKKASSPSAETAKTSEQSLDSQVPESGPQSDSTIPAAPDACNDSAVLQSQQTGSTASIPEQAAAAIPLPDVQ